MAAGQRQARPAPPPGEFKYASYIECEEKQHAHRVTPTVWPPQRINAGDFNPTVALPCLDCGCVCIVYAAHATGELPGIEVILAKPSPAKG